MSETFVVGDVHGCLDQFEALLKECQFRPKRDRLWLVGDIVNRGPASLAMLRRAVKLEQELGSRFAMVLGNHEIHLLKVALGLARQRRKDTLDAILEADDRKDLLRWLRHRPLAHSEGEFLMVHAGLLPHWSASDASSLARRLEVRLRKGEGKGLLRRRHATRSLGVLTRIRMLDQQGKRSSFNGSPAEAPKALEPWFKQWVKGRSKTEARCTVLFGHWAALGQREGGKGRRRWISLDSGCVYGRQLSALRLSDRRIVSVDG